MLSLFSISILKLSVSMASSCSPFMSICISYYNPFAFFFFIFLLIHFLSFIRCFLITLQCFWIAIRINIYCPWIYFILYFLLTLFFVYQCISRVIFSILWIKVNSFIVRIFWSNLWIVALGELLIFTLILKTLEIILTFHFFIISFLFFPFVLSHLSVFSIVFYF